MPFHELILFHYHLRKGGVTDVIHFSIESITKYLPEIKKIHLVVGNHDNLEPFQALLNREGISDKLTVQVLPGLDYLSSQKNPPKMRELKDELFIRFGGKQRLWWIHNYHLGKNPLFTEALLEIADKEQPMLFQIHDFPECARYENLQLLKKSIQRDIYPRNPSVRYALINQRDYDLILKSGISKEQAFLLDNPVPLGKLAHEDKSKIKKAMHEKWGHEFTGFKPDGSLFFYPVRAIRRKNILEAGFLTCLMENPANLLVTLPGVSSKEKEYSQACQEAFQSGLIPGMFGLGIRDEDPLLNYSNYWAASDMLLSSSIQEGFGYLYLNSLHWKKPLCARFLDILGGITPFFQDQYTHFYNQVSLPLEKGEKDNTLMEYQNKLDLLIPYIGKDATETLMSQLKEKMTQGELDFSYLSLSSQYEVLKKIRRDRSYKRACFQANFGLLSRMAQLLKSTVPSLDSAISERFGEEGYAINLRRVLSSYETTPLSEDSSGDVQQFLIKEFTTLPYIRLLY